LDCRMMRAALFDDEDENEDEDDEASRQTSD
jgi:hypothetical protein